MFETEANEKEANGQLQTSLLLTKMQRFLRTIVLKTFYHLSTFDAVLGHVKGIRN